MHPLTEPVPYLRELGGAKAIQPYVRGEIYDS